MFTFWLQNVHGFNTLVVNSFWNIVVLGPSWTKFWISCIGMTCPIVPGCRRWFTNGETSAGCMPFDMIFISSPAWRSPYKNEDHLRLTWTICIWFFLNRVVLRHPSGDSLQKKNNNCHLHYLGSTSRRLAEFGLDFAVQTKQKGYF